MIESSKDNKRRSYIPPMRCLMLPNKGMSKRFRSGDRTGVGFRSHLPIYSNRRMLRSISTRVTHPFFVFLHLDDDNDDNDNFYYDDDDRINQSNWPKSTECWDVPVTPVT